MQILTSTSHALSQNVEMRERGENLQTHQVILMPTEVLEHCFSIPTILEVFSVGPSTNSSTTKIK